jgi:hypothetical protein
MLGARLRHTITSRFAMRSADGLLVSAARVAPDIEIEIDLAQHPNFAGELVLQTPRSSRMKRLYDEGKVDDFGMIFGATNVLHVFVERHMRGQATRAAEPRAEGPSLRGKAKKKWRGGLLPHDHRAGSLGSDAGVPKGHAKDPSLTVRKCAVASLRILGVDAHFLS